MTVELTPAEAELVLAGDLVNAVASVMKRTGLRLGPAVRAVYGSTADVGSTRAVGDPSLCNNWEDFEPIHEDRSRCDAPSPSACGRAHRVRRGLAAK